MAQTVKMGVIRAISEWSAHALHIAGGEIPGMELTAVADRSEARRQWAKENLPATVKIFCEGSELIESGACEAVEIATPHYQHPELSIMAMDHGLHVMCEKPAGVYTKQVREMNEKAAQSDVVFGMMFNQRTNCVYRKMHDWCTAAPWGPLSG